PAAGRKGQDRRFCLILWLGTNLVSRALVPVLLRRGSPVGLEQDGSRRSRRTATIGIFTSSFSAGRGAFFAMPISKALVWKLSSSISFPGNTTNPIGVVPLIQARAGPKVCRPRSRKRCDAVAISNCATYL